MKQQDIFYLLLAAYAGYFIAKAIEKKQVVLPSGPPAKGSSINYRPASVIGQIV